MIQAPQNSPSSSPSSSPSTVASLLAESRASTPGSDLPEVFVHLPSPSPGPATINAAFDSHAAAGRLGLIFDTSCKDTHTSAVLDTDVYFPSPKPYTDPTNASHLLAIVSASLRVTHTLCTNKGTVYFVERPAFAFPPLGDPTQGNIPTPEEWRTLWATWDTITLQMIPPAMLHQKPIDLRHKCLFYIGHIPTFLDMLLSKAIGGSPTEPKYFWNIFERGIDPHVDDPDHCHNHSEVPEKDEDWPTLDTIIQFRNGVRDRLMRLYDDIQNGKRTLTRNIARTLVMTLEHEAWHVETLLYMLIQRADADMTQIGTLPPPGFAVPKWDVLVQQWKASIPPPSSPSVVLGPATITLGHNDSEADDKLPEHAHVVDGVTFGWDNESPRRDVHVAAFRAEWRPITNREFEAFWMTGAVEIPKSWMQVNGDIMVRTIHGPVPMVVAADWPVLAAYDDLALYARSKGGRLPTEPELRLFLDMYDVGHAGGANVGFRNWHPVPATTGLDEYAGKGSNGGVWEWTSTLFDGHRGLSPTNLFTGYSTDFFDQKHQIVLGASYATIPRLAGRRTIRNFYQHNYPYAWVSARVVYDA